MPRHVTIHFAANNGSATIWGAPAAPAEHIFGGLGMTRALELFPIGVACMAIALLSACGGGGSGNPSSSVTTYQVSATAGTGGTISPASATVNAGSTTTLALTANNGYAVSSVTGCGGTLSGNAYTTGTINASCTVTASF